MSFFLGGGGVGAGGGGARLSEIFYKVSKSIKEKKNSGGGGEGGRWTDRRKGPNQLAPSTSSKMGGITMHKCTSYDPDKLNL